MDATIPGEATSVQQGIGILWQLAPCQYKHGFVSRHVLGWLDDGKALLKPRFGKVGVMDDQPFGLTHAPESGKQRGEALGSFRLLVIERANYFDTTIFVSVFVSVFVFIFAFVPILDSVLVHHKLCVEAYEQVDVPGNDVIGSGDQRDNWLRVNLVTTGRPPSHKYELLYTGVVGKCCPVSVIGPI